MDKRVKSILPKPSGLPSPVQIKTEGTPSGPVSGTKRHSVPVTTHAEPKRQRSKSANNVTNYGMNDIDNGDGEDAEENSNNSKQAGHRPVTSCSFCRQHKIKCNASENYPNPCSRCERMALKCEIDPKFRPKKGSQIQILKKDVDELKAKIELLTRNETLLTQALNQHNLNFLQQQQQQTNFNLSPQQSTMSYHNTPVQRPVVEGMVPSPRNSLHLDDEHHRLHLPQHLMLHMLNPRRNLQRQISHPEITHLSQPILTHSPAPSSTLTYTLISEFILGLVHLPLSKANELHERFISKHLPFFPIFESNSATELYHKSQLLFWSIMLTSALSEPEPELYMSLASLIKQLAIETCWIHTPRSTHVIQALIVLSLWPLPNEKILDDCSYRFIGLAKKLSLQLGLHRGGEFIQEFSRTQVSLGPNSEYWRTRSWLAVFFCEQFWSSVLGLPPLINTTDYLIENARVDTSLPNNFRCLISLSIFQCKLVNVMGVSVTSPDGLLEPLNRAGSLNLLDRELERLRFKLPIDDGSAIEVYFLYVKLMICCFAFLPGTPIEDQVKYVSTAYLSATRIITIISQMISNNTVLLIELPIYVRQAITYSVLLLFKLQLSRYLIDKYIDSARQLIVTVHRLLRNTLSSWKDLQNDISRTARLLENLNIVLLTYPDIFNPNKGGSNDQEGPGSIISRMRSHLTASLFYDLVWCVHEARRRNLESKNGKQQQQNNNDQTGSLDYRKPLPLPFYNQITKDDFKTITTTTPNGTTITTLVPTDEALNQARLNANAKGLKEPLEINGIPLSMLDATGSVNELTNSSSNNNNSNNDLINDNDNSKNTNDTNNNNNSAPTPLTRLFLDVQRNFPSFGTGNLPLFDSSLLAAQGNIVQTPLPPLQLPLPGQIPIAIVGQNQPLSLPPLTNAFPNIPGATPIAFDVGSTQQNNGVTDQIANFLQQQSNGWFNNENTEDDDFLGWFDMNLDPLE